ncbi:DUF6235 family protein [Saccharopolyspora indica]|uniref:DUF6235 family protein n=1 Tax=Saccharopolyspora indica TaxID=1229659 RepID=UPI0022EB4AC0|nr:DUF6235 family protein [Saccharopolyspora indica]MDA3646989.1 DUF6235 family protein [Saccharopolyspora indica]
MRRVRLTSGLQLLELWSATAGQIQRNQVYEALFDIADGRAAELYEVVVGARGRELVVAVRPDLLVKVCFTSPSTFGLRYIGTPGDPAGSDVG